MNYTITCRPYILQRWRQNGHLRTKTNGQYLLSIRNSTVRIRKIQQHPKITSFVNENPESLNAIIGHPYDDKPVLYIACHDLSHQTRPDTIATLINLGANLFYTDDLHDHMEALHFAALGGNPKILKIVVDNIKDKEKINSVTSNYDTALNVLVKNGKCLEENYIECVLVLLEAGINVNIPDSKRLTPIFWAAKSGFDKVVENMLKKSTQYVDIDSHKLHGKSARDYIKEKGMTVTTPNNNEIEDSSFYKANNESDNRIETPLQAATKNGLFREVEFLLNNGADPNDITKKNSDYPITIAAINGYHKILQKLLECENIVIPPGLLIHILKHLDTELVTEEKNFHLCYDVLVKSEKISFHVNDSDEQNKTALHYAARYGGSDKVLDLLRLGASMACKNKYGALPIEDIDANTLETHLDECMIANVDGNIDKETFETKFNYKTFMPPVLLTPTEMLNKENEVEIGRKLIASEIQQLSRETEVISYISKSPEMKHLLMHPTITSFLYIKWHRISCLLRANWAFYSLFCVILLVHIVFVYGKHKNEASTTASTIILSIVFGLLLFREVFQIIVSPKTYFYNLENYIELLIIALTAYILFEKSPSDGIRKQVSAFAILFGAIGMVLLIGQHPKLSTKFVMLRTVSSNFLRFFLTYSILIMAFALSFYILLEDEIDENNNKNENDDVEKKSDDEINFFANPALSLFKTIVMLTGEFDAGSIKFDSYPITTHLIFMFFVIMIAIVLLNLLNGLAVNDTQMIQRNAELVAHIALIERLAYIECMLLGDILPSHFVNCLQKYFCCLPLSIRKKIGVPSVLAKRVCLFPYFLSNYELVVYPNQRGKVRPAVDYNEEPTSCVGQCVNIHLDKQSTKRIKRIIQERRESLIAGKLQLYAIDKQNELINQQQKDIEELKQMQKLILSKLDYIISQKK
ncbi:hypothetical protein FQR65_LT01664 [Abscondita terminalis]|nr:hypothetical protein FQR65_LT01664 [Abscondita terminalis]